MQRSVLALLLALFLALPGAAAPKRQVFDYAFLISTARSMSGLPHGSGNTIILPPVKDVVKAFLADAAPGSNVFITPFAEKPGASRRFRIQGSDDVVQVQRYLDGLPADGDGSRPFAALSRTLDRMVRFRRRRATEEHVALTFVYTDAVDDAAGAGPVMARYRRLRGRKDWLFFTTLGADLQPAAAAAIKTGSRIRCVEEKPGEVHPALVIETRIPFLDFGNLKQTGSADRLELFGIHFGDKLPEGLQIRARARFKEVAAAGGSVILTPESLPPEERATLKLGLANRQIRDGEYRGVVQLTPTDPKVVVVPPAVAIRFVGEPERTVALLPGNQPWPLGLGRLAVWKQRQTPVDVLCSIVMQYNARAEARGGTLQVRVEPDPRNPAALGPGRNFLINTSPTMTALVKPPAKSVEIDFRAAANLKPGTYRGVLVFSSDDFTVSGIGLNPDPRYPGGLVLPWDFTVPRAPWPPWVRWTLTGLGILAVPLGLVLGMAAFRGESAGEMIGGWLLSAGLARPRLRDAVLEMLEPRERRGTEYDLQGQETVVLGQGGAYFPDVDARVELACVLEGTPRSLGLRLKVVTGEAFLKRAQERKEVPVEDERVYDGDIIRLGRYKMRLNSFSLQRE